MTEVVRLTLVSHAMTDAMAAGRFPADEPLNDTGRRQAEAAARLAITAGTRQFTASRAACPPNRAAAGPAAPPPSRGWPTWIAGAGAGKPLDAVGHRPTLRLWLTDPAAAPHGGESIVDLIDRVAGWLESLTDNTLRDGGR